MIPAVKIEYSWCVHYNADCCEEGSHAWRREAAKSNEWENYAIFFIVIDQYLAGNDREVSQTDRSRKYRLVDGVQYRYVPTLNTVV